MNSLLVIAFLAVVVSADIISLRTQFNQFKAKYGKHYASPAEEAKRFMVFRANAARVAALNKAHGDPVFGVTKFMDLSPAEFRELYLIKTPLQKPDAPVVKPVVTGSIPTSFDWRNSSTNCVTAVKNQEQCGSCWAFSATEEIESIWILAGNKVQILAPQQIVDCDTHGQDQGCDGGWPYGAYEYVISAGGMEPESDYPYTAVDGTCKFKKADVVAQIKSWNYVTQDKNETAMLDWVATTSPLSVCVDATTWQFYTTGVLKGQCGTQIDHCVQLVGYQNMDSTNVWDVRNSWGLDWGMEGYIYVRRGANTCAIAEVVTVVVASS